MRDGNLPYAILALIAGREDGIHGYGLRAEFNALYGDTYPMDYGRLYRILAMLEASGHLTLQACVQATRPAKKVYRINDKGLASLDQWLSEPLMSCPQPLADEVSARLLVVRPDDVAAIAGIVRQYRHVCLDRLAHASRKQRALHKAAIDERIARLIVDGSEASVRAELAWLERIERSVVKEWT